MYVHTYTTIGGIHRGKKREEGENEKVVVIVEYCSTSDDGNFDLCLALKMSTSLLSLLESKYMRAIEASE